MLSDIVLLSLSWFFPPKMARFSALGKSGTEEMADAHSLKKEPPYLSCLEHSCSLTARFLIWHASAI